MLSSNPGHRNRFLENFHLAFNTLIATRIITPTDAIGRFSASCNHQIKASLSAHVSLLGLQVE